MKKLSRRILFALLTVAMLVAMAMPAMAAKKAEKYQNVDAIESVQVDYSKSNVFTMNGWYEKTLDSGRTVKMYFPEIAQCRAYFTVVAAPAGVTDVQKWSKTMGFTKMIEDRGEVLVILTPEKKWGKLDKELAYVTEAMNFVNSGKNAAGVTLFTNYSTFYLVGFDGGCAPLEAWSADHPILVDSQVFVGGKTAGKAKLNEIGAAIYDGTNNGGYDPGIADLELFKQVLGEHGYPAEPITRADVPVPTWFINYKATDYSLKYWKNANDCSAKNSGTANNRVYWQKLDSDAFQTEYANSCIKSGHGMSQVKVSYSFNATAKKLGAFLYKYSRYNVPFAYSNHLSERMDYTAVRVAAQKAANKAGFLTEDQFVAYESPITSDAGVVYDGYYVLARESGKVGKGTVESGIIAFSDDNKDGTLDAREYLMYIPKSAKGKKAPVVLQYPGMTQSVSVGFDSTQWWRVADDEGVIIVIMGEAYNNGVALSWMNSDMETRAVLDILKKNMEDQIDWSRIYGSGHSLGSNQVQDYVHTHPEFFTAVASTSFGNRVQGGAYEAVPTMLVTGQADLPFLMSNLWTSSDLKSWFGYLADANSLKVVEATPENADAKVEGTARTYTYTWNNKDEIPMVVWGQTYLREHNCYPAEVPMAYDFLKNYSRVDGVRYYQGKEIKNPAPLSMVNVESIQAYTDDTIYGAGLTQVAITYKDGVDVSKATAADYVLLDRGSLNPDFGEIEIAKVSVNKQVVTLDIAYNTTDATEKNAMVYTGPDAGARERNAFGIYPTGAWYRDENGTIHFGKDPEDAYEDNTTGMGYQSRACLELKLRYVGDIKTQDLANAQGQYNENSKWLPTVDRVFTVDGFKDVAELKIPSTAAPATDGTGADYVEGYYFIPENYDPANGIVFTLQGQGISYWKLADGCDNKRTGLFYDSATTSWANKGAIVVNIHDRSGAGKGEYTQYYDYIVDDVNVMKYFIETYGVTGNVVIQGNSRGTAASNFVIRALAGLPYRVNGNTNGELKTLDKKEYPFQVDSYICQNGTFLSGMLMDEVIPEYWEGIAATGLKVWVFDGEQDANNIATVASYKDYLKKAGYSDAWIEENVRHTGLPSELFAYWGESDHSVTRINPYYFADEPYYGSDLEVVDGKIVYNTKLNPGDTYTVKGRGNGNVKDGYEYKVYGEIYQQWALADTDVDAAVCAQTWPGDFGSKLKAVFIKYNDVIDGSKLSVDDFEVRAIDNNLKGTFKNSTLTRVYTNDKPEVLAEGSVPGQYVVIETDDLDKVGLVADNFYYKKADASQGSLSLRRDLNGTYFLSVEQKSDIVNAAGKVVSAAKKAPMNISQDAIDYDVLDEFQYLHLTDEEADEVLSHFTFKNNNSPYSLSSNTTNFDHNNLKENELLGDLNHATLSGLGVNIWYQLPDNYDPSKKYPLFLYNHGTGECLTFATTGDGTELSNFGVHFNIGRPATSWAVTEDYGYEDVIVVAPQYYSGNSPRPDGYERDDSVRATLCYALENFAVDRDRVYVSGTSQGAGRTTALVRDCAEYITAAIVQNGGYSSKLAASKDLDAIGQHQMIFDFATKENVAVWFFQGVNDFISRPLTAEVMYDAVQNNYKAAGRSDAWLTDNTRFTYLNNKIYLDMNETSYHSTMKPTYRWYAVYKDALYHEMYSDAEDSLGEYFDTKYGHNDPNGYEGMIQWALSKKKSELMQKEDMDNTAVDFDSYTEKLTYDYSQAAQLPLTGYFKKTVAEGRTMKMYISDTASVRSYMTVVAVPNGVKTYEFLEKEGWIDVMEEKGEVLVVLEPGKNGWGTAAEEIDYVNAAMSFVRGTNNAHNIPVFSTFGEFYFVGYGEGAAPLECYAAMNPILVIAQEYIGGVSVGNEALDAVSSTLYDGKSSNGDITDVLDETIAQVGISGAAAPKDLAVPTVLAGYTGSEAHWMNANNCAAEAVDGVYPQVIDAANYSTDYANARRKAMGETTGISQVKITAPGAKAAEIYNYLAQWTRYDTTFAYSNAIADRLDYTAAKVAAQVEAKDGVCKKVLSDGTQIWGQSNIAIDGHGTVQVGVMAFSDDNNDGAVDPREYIVYIPEGFEGKSLPIEMIYAGNSQTDIIFMDSTLWWQIAEKEGIALVFVCETYSSNATVVSHKNSDLFYKSLITLLKDEFDGKCADFDFNRIYGSGQSAGSSATQGFAVTNPEFFAAVASTSATPTIKAETASNQQIPTFMITGQMDAGNMAQGFESPQMISWADYFLATNGIKADFAAKTATTTNVDPRHPQVYTWTKVAADNSQIPMVGWGQCLLRPHNCYPSDMPILWDFQKHYCMDENGVRYYSASAFAENDLVVIPVGQDFDNVKSLSIDNSQAAQLPLTGLWNKNIVVNGEVRTVKAYIAEEASVRSYFTVVAVPDGVDTCEFLEKEGWFAVADEKGEGLFVLEPGKNGWGSVAEEKAYVDAAIAFLKSGSNANRVACFTTYGEFYLVGYGAGSAPLEVWSAENPTFVISQAFLGGASAPAEVLAEAGAFVYDGTNTSGYDKGLTDPAAFEASLAETGLKAQSKAEIPVPTWFAGKNYKASLKYWMCANDCLPKAVGGIYYQNICSTKPQTAYANSIQPKGSLYGISQVKTTTSSNAKAAKIYGFLSQWTRYDNTFAYANALGLRLDYTAARVAAQQAAKDGEIINVLSDGTGILAISDTQVKGHGTVQCGIFAFGPEAGASNNDVREYLMFIPDGYKKKNLPILMVYPGMTQSDSIFLDSTMWWKVAEDKGFAVVVVCETYSSPVAITHKDQKPFYNAMMTILKEEVNGVEANLDFSRIYGTGQSMGSMTTQGFVQTNPEFYAAAASTSGISNSNSPAGHSVPTMLIAGQSDLSNLLPDLWHSDGLLTWANYLFSVNGLEGATVDSYNSYEFINNRTKVYTWNNAAGIPMVKYGQTILRPHNCHPSEMPILWDFMEHFCYEVKEDGTIARYYSPSAFSSKKSDLVKVIEN